MTTAATIIETSAGQLYQVRPHADPDLSHVWLGVAVKRASGDFVPKANAREILVRKAQTRIVRA